MKPHRPGDAGFSLIELMIAMLVTVIVSGAIFGLMTVGQTAFKREPARADQQQNLRAAMDSIQRDIAAAGGQINPWVQAFTAGDGAGETAPPLLNAGPGGSDFLQIFGADGSCPNLLIDREPGPCSAGTPCPGGCGQASSPNTGVCGPNAFVAQEFPACYGPPPPLAVPILAALTSPTSFYVGTAVPTGSLTTAIPIYLNYGGAPQSPRLFRCGGSPACPAVPPPLGAPPPTDVLSATVVQVIRYEIAPDPADGVLALWRSITGGVNLATGVYTSAATVPNAPGGWVLVARGIEDLGVWYIQAGNPPVAPPPVLALPNPIPGNSPAIVTAGNFGTLVQQVRVTLTGRTILEGGLSTAVGDQDFRTRLTGVATPRSALAALAGAPPPFTWQ
jgi:prepilin-type N-terminal cleavage/methylation domain-containing protein